MLRCTCTVLFLGFAVAAPASQRLRASFLEIDTVTGVPFPPHEVTHLGRTYSLKSIFQDGGIDLDVRYDESSIPRADAYDDPELHAMMLSHKNPTYGEQPDKWSAWCVVVTRSRDRPSILGVLFDIKGRQGCAVFFETSGFTGGLRNRPKAFLRAFAHEVGHVFNLLHSDGDRYSIMVQTADIEPLPDEPGTPMRLEFTEKSKNHLANDPEEFVRPGGSGFGEGRS